MILDKILTQKKQEVAQAATKIPLQKIQEKAADAVSAIPIRPFLTHKTSSYPLELIAEIKKASPSRGLIRDFENPSEIARAYNSGGASAISVLTDESFFQGHPSYLQKVRSVTGLPLLRKDFIIDSYQIYESRVLGADAILLIAAALTTGQLKDFLNIASELGLQTLVEVHTEEELAVVLDTSASIIGINNRNLHTFHTDINTTLRLREKIKNPVLKVVSESGIKTAQDIELLAQHGVDAVLIGETLMAAENPLQKIKELFKADQPILNYKEGGLADES